MYFFTFLTQTLFKCYPTIVLLLISTLSLSAQVGNTYFSYEETPKWVKAYPSPTVKDNYDVSLALIHDEEQYNHVKKEFFQRKFYFIQDVKGLNKLKDFNINFEPDYRTVAFHSINIYRKDKKIELRDKIHIECSFDENWIGDELFQSDGKLKIFLEQTRIGDVVEISYTEKGLQPDIYGSLFYKRRINSSAFIGNDYIRILTHKDNPIYYKSLNCEIQINEDTTDKYYIIETINYREKVYHEDHVPNWYYLQEYVFFTDKSNWTELIEYDLKNYKLEQPTHDLVKEKVKELIAGIEDTTEQISKILNYVQHDIIYLTNGTITPKQPEVVIRQGRGDCKAKSLLALKMLKELNIEAWIVAVNSEGYDARLMDLHTPLPFNHAVLEFIYQSDTIIFDGTRYHQYGNMYEKYIPDFMYGLRIIRGNNELTKLKPSPPSKIVFDINIKPYKNSNWINFNINRDVKFYDESAFIAIQKYEKSGKKQIWNTFFNVRDIYPYCDWKDSKSSFEMSENKKEAILHQEYIDCNDYHRRSFMRARFKPEVLANLLKDDIYENVGQYFPLYTYFKLEFNYKIELSNKVYYYAKDYAITNDWLKFEQKIYSEGQTVYAYYSLQFLKPYLPKDRVDEVAKVLKKINRNLSITINKKDFWERLYD